MKDANNQNCEILDEIVQGVIAHEHDSQTVSELIAGRMCLRKCSQTIDRGPDTVDQPRRNGFGGFNRDIGPYLGKVRFSGIR